jgi:hypothetical protein
VKDGIGQEMAGQFGLRFRLPHKSQGSLTCRKSATWDRRFYFPSEGRHAVDIFARPEASMLPLPLGRHRRRWEDNIKMDFQEVGCGGMGWIDVASNRGGLRALVNSAMNLRFS